MITFQDRRVLAAAGAGLALLAGIAIAMFFMNRDRPAGDAEAARSGLTVEMSEATTKVDPNRQLRCFVGGQFVGQATLAECARRNGISAQALDVGLDESGALAAGENAALQPLENVTAPAQALPDLAAQATPALPPPVVQANAGECLRHGPDGWRVIGTGAVTLNACLQQLFDGRCVRPGDALYGRWSSQTLRLTANRVESSTNNRDFTTLVEQGPNCALPPL